jgi:hypothetical protein
MKIPIWAHSTMRRVMWFFAGAALTTAVATHQVQKTLEQIRAANVAALHDQAAHLTAQFDEQIELQAQANGLLRDQAGTCERAEKNAADLDEFSSHQLTLLYEPGADLPPAAFQVLDTFNPGLGKLIAGMRPPSADQKMSLHWVLYHRPGEKFVRALMQPVGGRAVSSFSIPTAEAAQ